MAASTKSTNPPIAPNGSSGAFIELRGIHKRFGRQEILRGIDLSIHHGETLCIIGPRGEGKTVMMKHIIGLIQPDKGDIFVEGICVNHLREREMAPIRQKVSEKPTLNPTFTGVILDLELFHDVQIPADATFSIGSAGLMGDALIDIKPSGKDTKEFLPHEHDRIIDGTKSGGLSELQSQAEIVGKKVDLVLDDVRTALADLKGAMEKINKGALSDATITDFKESMQHLNKTMTRVDDKVLGEETVTNLKDAIAELKEAATGFKSTAKNIDEQSKRLGPMFDKLDPAMAKANNVMTTAEESLQSIKKAADSFAIAARNITTSKGLLGSLMNDSELKTDFKGLISNLKRNGIIFYHNDAGKEKSKEEPSKQLPIFRR